MIVRPWAKGDTEKINLQSAQQYMHAFIDMSADLSELSTAGFAWVAEHEGEVLAIAGLVPQWENRALAWALLSGNCGEHFWGIHSAVHRFLDQSPYRRIEAHVDAGFKQGHRWITMLGFEIEGYMKAFRPDGSDMLLYARVKP